MAEPQSDNSQSIGLTSKAADDQQQHLIQAGGSSAQSHPRVPDNDMPESDSWSTPDDGWSISCSHTMTCGYTGSSTTSTDEPEIDIIDGESFMSFETLEQIDKYTRANDNRITGGPIRGKRIARELNTATASSSAFMSKSLDDFLMQEIGRSPVPNHSASLPPDSRIYETGVLKMDSVRKPFADLPHLHPFRDNITALPPPPPLMTIEKNSPSHKVAMTEPVTAKRKNTTAPDFDATKVTADEMEEAVHRLNHEAVKHSAMSRKSRYISFRMDESYCNNAVGALATASTELPEPESPNKKFKKSNKKVKNSDESAFSPSKSPKETDLIAMISRNRDGAKRDIRLPSRYQESALVEGNSWICAAPFGCDAQTDKRPRKRLIEEQRRLLILKQPVISGKVVPRIICKNKSPAKRKFAQHAGKAVTPSAKIQSPLKSSVKKKPPILMPTPQLPIRPSPELPVPQPAAAPSAVALEPKASSGMYMKFLYRELFFACGTERRDHYAQIGVKPRVNKAKTVDEAIAVIKRLQLRERQLLYINQLLSLWHRKLDLCAQVVENKVRPEPNPNKDTRTVVLSVLKAYRDSFCYKLSARLPEYLTKFPTEQQQQLPIPPSKQVHVPKYVMNGRRHDSESQEAAESHSQKISVASIASGDKAPAMVRPKKIRSQSLLMRNQFHHKSQPNLIVPDVPAAAAAAGDAAPVRGPIVNVSENAHSVLKDGKLIKQFTWVNNHQITPGQLIPKNGHESSIMSSTK